MVRLYLDWNVITTLRQPDILTSKDDIYAFDTLAKIIDSSRQSLIIPYSNAHLNDLLRNYKKGEYQRVKDSLKFISILTQEVCLSQYWDEKNAKCHRRNPEEYFQDLLDNEDTNFISSFESITEPLREFGLDTIFNSLKQIPHGIDFKQLDKHNPTLFLIFKKSRIDNSIYAVMEDIISLFNDLRNNPTVYNELKKLFRSVVPIDDRVHDSENVVELLDQILPKTMLNKSFTELYQDNNKTDISKNTTYSKLTGIFMQLDFVGYASDKLTEKNKYDNLFNDALHCFYAAHCDFFLTSDKKTYKKTKAVFESEDIATKVMKPKEFVDYVLNA